MNEQKVNLVFVIETLRLWRKWVLGVTLFAMVGAAVVSMIVPEYFQAITIVFPYSPQTSDPRTLFQEEGVSDIFGSKEDVDRIISVGLSRELARKMIADFKLAQHYEIDSATRAFETKLLRKWYSNVAIVRNDKGAIEIRVLDTDPQTAALLANNLVTVIDAQYMQTIEVNNRQQLAVYEANELQIAESVRNLQSQLDSLMRRNPGAIIGKEGVLGNAQPSDAARMHSASIQLSSLSRDLAEAARKRYQMQSALKAQTRALMVVEAARVPEIRHTPVRTVWVLSTGVVSFGLMLLFACFLTYYRQQLPPQD